MFEDRRDYRAVAFACPRLRGVADIAGLLPRNAVMDLRVLSEPASDLEITHSHYYSTNRFTASAELDKLVVTRRGIHFYRYDVYFLATSVKRQRVFLVAVPFFRMGIELFGMIRERSRGHGLLYQVVNLDRLLALLSSPIEMTTRPKISFAEFTVFGDEALTRLSLAGENVLQSVGFSLVRRSLTAKGIGLNPRKCAILYDDHQGKRFRLQADSFGNLRFRVGFRAHNLPFAQYLLSFLYTGNVMDSTPAYPLRKGVVEEEDGDNG